MQQSWSFKLLDLLAPEVAIVDKNVHNFEVIFDFKHRIARGPFQLIFYNYNENVFLPHKQDVSF